MSKGKKITLISVVGVVLALVVAVIVLSSVSMGFNNYVKPGFNRITIYHNGKMNDTIINSKDAVAKNYENFNKLSCQIEKSSEEKVLTSIFQGANSFKSSLVEKSFNSTDLTSLVSNSENTFIILHYTNEQMVKFGEQEVKYYSIIMEVKNSENLAEATIYFQKENYLSISNMKSDFNTTILAKQADLYELISKIV